MTLASITHWLSGWEAGKSVITGCQAGKKLLAAARHSSHQKPRCPRNVNVPCRTYGDVFCALDKAKDRMVAIKVLALDSEDELAPIQAEIDILKQCDSNYVVKYYDSFFTGGEPWVSRCARRRMPSRGSKHPYTASSW
jgi:hypothetical protein